MYKNYWYCFNKAIYLDLKTSVVLFIFQFWGIILVSVRWTFLFLHRKVTSLSSLSQTMPPWRQYSLWLAFPNHPISLAVFYVLILFVGGSPISNPEILYVGRSPISNPQIFFVGGSSISKPKILFVGRSLKSNLKINDSTLTPHSLKLCG